MIYKIKAYWPDSRSEPATHYAAHFADALEQALGLMRTHRHTTILVLIDALELVRLWGQPMANGDNWP